MSLVGSVLRVGSRAVDAGAAWTGMAVDDIVHLGRTLDGNGIDAWDPDYIRRVLLVWRAVMGTYFRGEVCGLDNTAEDGPSVLVGNPSAGTLIDDDFVLAGEFYEPFGTERGFHQLS